MTFEHLTAAQLAGALAAFTGALAALQFLRVHRRRVRVSSVRLWRSLAEREKPRILWQRWRDALSFATLLGIGSLLLCALAGPMRSDEGQRRRALVLVIDTGYSMGAREGAGVTRLDLARREAARLLSTLRPDDRVAIIAAGFENRVLVSLSAHHPRLTESLRQLELSEAPGHLSEAIALAKSVADGQGRAEIVVISDRPRSRFDRNDSVRQVAVGRRSDNAAITGLAVTQPTVGNPRARVEVTVTNAGEATLRGRLRLVMGERAEAAIPVELSPRESRTYAAEVAVPRSAKLALTLDTDDALPTDNRAVVQLIRPRSLRVRLAANAAAVVRALTVDPDVVLVNNNDCDVLVTDRSEALSHPTLFVGPTPGLVAESGTVSGTLKLSGDHPALAGFDFKDVSLSGATSWRGQALATVQGSPVLVAGDRDGHRFLLPGWQLADEATGFPQRAQFVAFIARAIRWLAAWPRERSVVATVGERLTVEFMLPAEVTLNLPNGDTEQLGAVGQRFVFVPRQVGIHTFATRAETGYVSAIRQSAEAADITPASESRGSQPTSTPTTRPLWHWLALGALVLLLVEWWAFLKRVTV